MLRETFDLFLVLLGSFVIMYVAFLFFLLYLFSILRLLRFGGLRMTEQTFVVTVEDIPGL